MQNKIAAMQKLDSIFDTFIFLKLHCFEELLY